VSLLDGEKVYVFVAHRHDTSRPSTPLADLQEGSRARPEEGENADETEEGRVIVRG
jgi:hypothetical protein